MALKWRDPAFEGHEVALNRNDVALKGHDFNRAVQRPQRDEGLGSAHELRSTNEQLLRGERVVPVTVESRWFQVELSHL